MVNVEFPSSVTFIGDNAFNHNEIKRVTLSFACEITENDEAINSFDKGVDINRA